MDRKDSVCRAFEDLKEFIRKNNIAVSPAKSEAIPDFAEAMKDVRRISHHKEALKKGRAKRAGGSRQQDALVELSRALRKDEPLDVVNLPEYMEGYVEGLNPLTMEKLRQGEFSIEKTLDLHGLHIDDAEDAFSVFLQEAIRQGLRCIRVIHGRGLKSRERPILKENLKGWIIRAINRRWIVAFASARMIDGGTGATYVLLKGKPSKRRVRVIG